MENVEARTESWQVDTGGKVFDTNFDEMTFWIAEGALLRIDRVRKGNLRWIEAGKVPQLVEFFNAKDAGEPIMPVVTTTNTEVLGVAEPTQDFDNGPPTQRFETARTTGQFNNEPPTDSVAAADVCAMHPDLPAAWACDTCSNLFCKTCPTGYGANVKICPFCGAMCRSLAQAVVQARTYRANVRTYSGESFGFSDFGNALAYPFKFTFSLIVGAIMFAAFSIGSGAGGFGGIFAMVGGIVCLLCSNMLSFGVLANTVESFSQGKLDVNFMPSFEDFSLWDDVVHPFFLSIGVYISSFGPFIAVVLVAVFMVVGTVRNEINGFQDDAANTVQDDAAHSLRDDAARTVNPELPYAAKAAQQSEQVKELIRQANEQQKKRIEMMEQRERAVKDEVAALEDGREIQPNSVNRPTLEDPEKWHNPSAVIIPSPSPAVAAQQDPEEEEFNRVNKMIQENRKAQLESVVGKTSETKQKEQAALIKQILGYGLLFVLLGGITLLWGLFYFPAACAVAGYTRSFAATLNPTVGLDTIRRLGGSYALILFFGLVLLVVSAVVSGVLGIVFLAFDLPGLGNLPAKFLGSMFGFYLSVVFSCILGYALFKKADMLELPG